MSTNSSVPNLTLRAGRLCFSLFSVNCAQRPLLNLAPALPLGIELLMLVILSTFPALCDSNRPYGLESRAASMAYLRMPDRAEGNLPKLLSETGAFQETANLVPSTSLIPYDLNISFWSDGAEKSRWIAIPGDQPGAPGRIGFSPTGEWTFPPGTVFVKHFEMRTDETRPELKRRLETRLLVCDATGGVYGVTYKWRPDNSDAELLATNITETLTIKTSSGVRTQAYYYPSPVDCRTCHTKLAGGVLGVKTRQINREFTYSSGVRDNQLRAWNHIGLFTPDLAESTISNCARLAAPQDQKRSLEDRARSWLDANCAQCHRPGGTVAYFDARYDTPLPKQGFIEGQVLIDEGIDNARIVAPRDIWRSIALLRISTLEALKMPPLAHNVVDGEAVALLKHWITSLPGPTVLPPPSIFPRGGTFAKPVQVVLSQTGSGATIHYTLDGSAPTKSDPVYERPIKITTPTVVRARTYKTGCTRSITVQEVFVVGE